MAKKSIKERISEARAKTRAAMKRGGAIAGNMKPIGVAAAAGAVADLGGQFAAEKIDLVGKNWYGQPALMLLAALLVRKKSTTAALGIAGAAGAKARFNYALNQFQTGKAQHSPVKVFGQPAAGGGGGGGNVGMLQDAGTGGSNVEMLFGQDQVA
ncbi:MAG: hypothetical protein KF718_16820 [Polyangiaceae bacterium]|nr:hypothetical protein [Polyangiaceae bacterium]